MVANADELVLPVLDWEAVRHRLFAELSFRHCHLRVCAIDCKCSDAGRVEDLEAFW